MYNSFPEPAEAEPLVRRRSLPVSGHEDELQLRSLAGLLSAVNLFDLQVDQRSQE